jgi:hypothetical protein
LRGSASRSERKGGDRSNGDIPSEKSSTRGRVIVREISRHSSFVYFGRGRFESASDQTELDAHLALY